MYIDVMNIRVIATTKSGYEAPREEFDVFGGHAAGVCYMQNDFDTLRSEDKEKTMKRVKLTKEAGHHSVYDHLNITLYLEGIPRVIELILNNERMMTSSVKSGRYTVHSVEGVEKKLYEKWVEIFEGLIQKQYQEKYPKFFTVSRIKKLAMENARYLTGAFTLVSMVHTISYRQLNYVYGFIRDFVAMRKGGKSGTFIKKLIPYLTQFLSTLDATGYIDEALTHNGKHRILSVFNKTKIQEYFGDVYATTYKGSFAYITHAHRHRTLRYYVDFVKEPGDLEFYVPEILRGTDHETQWQMDLSKVRNKFPQAMMLDITEMGNLDDFVLKVYERKCAVVLLETNRYTADLTKKYYTAMQSGNHPRADILKPFIRGSRCTFPGFTCVHPCNFADAISEKRKV